MIGLMSVGLIGSIVLIFCVSGLWQKIVAGNITISILIAMIVLIGLKTQVGYYLDIAFAFALLSFIGTQFFARFLAGRGEENNE